MKLLAPIALLLGLLAVVVWMDDTPADADIIFVNQNEVFTLDPQRMSYLQDLRLAHALYEGLERWDNYTFGLLPGAATAAPDVADDLTYTYRIRPEATWSNGDPLTAHDFIYAWKRAILPDTAADYSNLFFVIDGAEEFFHWRSKQTRAFAARADGDPDARRADAERLFDEAQARFADTVGLEALDDHTLRIRLRQPTAYFRDLLCFGVFFPVHRPTVEGWPDGSWDGARGWHAGAAPPFAERRWLALSPASGKLEQKHGWAKPEYHVGNGPYRLAEWRYKRDMRLERNDRFHDPDRVRSESVLALTIEDANTAVLAFESGRMDWLADVDAEYRIDMLAQRKAYEARYRKELLDLKDQGLSEDEALGRLPKPKKGERRNIHVLPTFGTDFYSFNCRPKLSDGRPNPFAKPAVRRAFTMATNKRVIVERVTRLHEPVLDTFIPPNSIPDYTSPIGLPHDAELARAELATEGWKISPDGLLADVYGNRFPVIDLLYTTNTPRYKWISLELKSQWERELGVRVELRGTETKFYKEDLKQGKFMIARGRWYGDYGDPTTFLDLCRKNDGNNDRKYSNEKFEELMNDAAQERDPAIRYELLTKCEQIICDEAPMLFVCQLVQVYMYEPGRVHGLSHHPRLTQFLWQLEVDDP